MPTRYRWYRIQIPRRSAGLSTIIAQQQLTDDTGFGFQSIVGEVDQPKYRFAWRTKVVLTRLDDEGSPSYEEVASLSFTDFVIIQMDGVTFLRIENPGRSLRELFNALESLIGFGFTSKQLTFEKAKPTTVFKNIEVMKLIGLKVVGAVIDEDLVARIEFASKQGIVSEKKMKLLERMQYTVESAVFDLVFEGLRGQLAFSSNGTVKISGRLAPRLGRLIEEDLALL